MVFVTKMRKQCQYQKSMSKVNVKNQIPKSISNFNEIKNKKVLELIESVIKK